MTSQPHNTQAAPQSELEPLAPMAAKRRSPTRNRTMVFIDRVRCPSCGSIDLQTRRTVRNGDETITRDTLCRVCEERFLVIVE